MCLTVNQVASAFGEFESLSSHIQTLRFVRLEYALLDGISVSVKYLSVETNNKGNYDDGLSVILCKCLIFAFIAQR